VAIFVILFLALRLLSAWRANAPARLDRIVVPFAAIAAGSRRPFFGGADLASGHRAGVAMAGMTVGILGCGPIRLLLPSFCRRRNHRPEPACARVLGEIGAPAPAGARRARSTAARPRALVWSLSLNILAYVVFSLGQGAGNRSSGCKPTCSFPPALDPASAEASGFLAVVGDGSKS